MSVLFVVVPILGFLKVLGLSGGGVCRSEIWGNREKLKFHSVSGFWSSFDPVQLTFHSVLRCI